MMLLDVTPIILYMLWHPSRFLKDNPQYLQGRALSPICLSKSPTCQVPPRGISNHLGRAIPRRSAATSLAGDELSSLAPPSANAEITGFWTERIGDEAAERARSSNDSV